MLAKAHRTVKPAPVNTPVAGQWEGWRAPRTGRGARSATLCFFRWRLVALELIGGVERVFPDLELARRQGILAVEHGKLDPADELGGLQALGEEVGEAGLVDEEGHGLAHGLVGRQARLG